MPCHSIARIGAVSLAAVTAMVAPAAAQSVEQFYKG
jgi:hypothetical protein